MRPKICTRHGRSPHLVFEQWLRSHFHHWSLIVRPSGEQEYKTNSDDEFCMNALAKIKSWDCRKGNGPNQHLTLSSSFTFYRWRCHSDARASDDFVNRLWLQKSFFKKLKTQKTLSFTYPAAHCLAKRIAKSKIFWNLSNSQKIWILETPLSACFSDTDERLAEDTAREMLKK